MNFKFLVCKMRMISPDGTEPIALKWYTSHHNRYGVYVGGFPIDQGWSGKASQFMYFIIAFPVRDSPGYSHMNSWQGSCEDPKRPCKVPLQ